MTSQISAKPGRKTEYDWDSVEMETYRLMNLRGEFAIANKKWNVQARLEDTLLEFCDREHGREPSSAALRRKLPAWLEHWRARQKAQHVQAAE